MKYFYLFSAFLFCLMLSQQAFSQINNLENHELVSAYKKIIPYPQDVFSGGQYAVAEAFHIQGTPFLESPEFSKSKISINGLTFDNILLNYDIQKDQLVTFHPNNFQRIIINAQTVDSFTLANGRSFIKTNENKNYFYHQNGYYEVLLDGKTTVLAKHFKVDELKKDYNPNDSKHFNFIHNSHYFILSKGQFYRINKKRDIAMALEIPKNHIKKVLKKRKLRFKKQTAESLVAIVQDLLPNLPKN